ncbi:MAG: SRPBCC family protein [Bacteroidales bacterium]
MTTFESNIVTINNKSERIFSMLSDLSNIERVKSRLPQDKFKEITFDSDTCRVSVDHVGTIGIRIIEREPNKTIKFVSDHSPIDFNLWIQLKETDENETKVKVTIKAELSSFMRSMIETPLMEALNKLTDMIAIIPY